MKLLSRVFGVGLAAWAVSRMLRRGTGRSMERQPEAVTRWEGEGGSTHSLEANPSAPGYAQSEARS